jgi:energy-coupling factor transporter transmembrane protein EcfT
MQKFVHSKRQASSDVHSSLASHGVTEQSSETIEGHQHAETKRLSDTDKVRLLVLIMIPALGLLQLALLYPLGVVGYLLILMGLLTGLAGIFTATRIYRAVISFGIPVVVLLSLISGFVTVTNPSEDWVNGPRWLASRGAKMWEPELKTVREESELFAVQQRMFTENSSHPRIKSTAGWLAPGAVTRVAKAPKMVRVEKREKAEKLWKENADAHTHYHEQRVSGIQRMYSAFEDALEAGIFQTKPAVDSAMLWMLIITATAVGDLLAGTLRVLRRRKRVDNLNS